MSKLQSLLLVPSLLLLFAADPALGQAAPPTLAPVTEQSVEVNPSVFQDFLPPGTDIPAYVTSAASVWSAQAARARSPLLNGSQLTGLTNRTECGPVSNQILVRATTRQTLIGRGILGIAIPCIPLTGTVTVIFMSSQHVPQPPSSQVADATATLIHELGHAWGISHSANAVSCPLMAAIGRRGLAGADRFLCTEEVQKTFWSPISSTPPQTRRYQCPSDPGGPVFLGLEPPPSTSPSAGWGGLTYRQVSSTTLLQASGFSGNSLELGARASNGLGTYIWNAGNRLPVNLGRTSDGDGLAAFWDEACCLDGRMRVWLTPFPYGSFTEHGSPEAPAFPSTAIYRAPAVSGTSSHLVAVYAITALNAGGTGQVRVAVKAKSAGSLDGWPVGVDLNMGGWSFVPPSVACNDTGCVVVQPEAFGRFARVATFDLSSSGAVSSLLFANVPGPFTGSAEVAWLSCSNRFALIRADGFGLVTIALQSSLSSTGWSTFQNLGSIVNGTSFVAIPRAPFAYSSSSELYVNGF